MKISSQLFEAYLYCPTKCWLHSRAEPISGNMYAEWARAHKNTYYEEGLQRAFATLSQSDRVITPPIPKNFKDATWQLAIGFLLRTNELETRLQAVARERNDGTIHFVPYRFEFLNKLTKEHKLLLAFDALLLSEVAKCEVKFGKIVHGDGHNTLKVKTSLLAAEVRKRLKGVTALVAGDSPPDLVLNRHCSQCEFQARCGQEALEKDELSLISRLSEKERKKLHRKGIFTVTQLSYTFRPRRHSARKTSQSLKYEPALKALAVRTKRAHVIGAPTLAIPGHPVYFDVEGVPDSDFYYLIGMRHWCRDKYEHCYFWADTPSDERTMWASCFRALVLIDTPRLIHYGNYETQFLKRMKARYCKSIEDSQFVDRLISSSVNLISLTYAQVYFPTYSNSLKEIARYLGFQWSDITASGLNAIAWRSGWDSSRDQSLKQRLLIYNEEDCMAVQRVADTIAAICVPMSKTTNSQLESVNVHFLVDRYRRMFSPTNFALPEFKQINEAAYWDYHRSKVYIRSGGRMRRPAKRTRGSSLTNKTRIDKVIQVGDQRPAKCSQCGSTLIHKNDRPTQIIFDINFFPSGPRRRVIRYLYYRYRCRDCYHYITNFKRSARFGSKLCAYIIYMMIEMRLSQRPICEHLKDIFSLHVDRRAINRIKMATAKHYELMYEKILQHINTGGLAHADETRVTVAGKSCYVWIFTNQEEAAFVYSESREARTAQEVLRGFQGVLVSDFYAGYDSIDCAQQKCLIHLMRDLNDDLHKQPFNEEMKDIASAFATLLQPMVKTIDRYGLKRRYLQKHKNAVKVFFDALSKRDFHTEVAVGYKNRFERFQEKLFTFIEHDGIPWNNNNAEHAVKAFVRLRNAIGGASTSKSIREYLVLLSVSETCKYKGINFLDFLRSDCKDIDDFAVGRKERRQRSAS